MATLKFEGTSQDDSVMRVARALAVANQAAHAHGVDPSESLVTIAEEPGPSGSFWRINYGPREYVNRRGGDLIVLVDEQTEAVQQVIRGQ